MLQEDTIQRLQMQSSTALFLQRALQQCWQKTYFRTGQRSTFARPHTRLHIIIVGATSWGQFADNGTSLLQQFWCHILGPVRGRHSVAFWVAICGWTAIWVWSPWQKSIVASLGLEKASVPNPRLPTGTPVQQDSTPPPLPTTPTPAPKPSPIPMTRVEDSGPWDEPKLKVQPTEMICSGRLL